MRNPKWHRDEIILALDLYFDSNRGTVDATNPKVIALSELLNKLPIFPNKPDQERFRNPNGVSLKLSNFLAIDPDHKGTGMNRHSKLDKAIFDEFVNDKKQLRAIASKIKSIVNNEGLNNALRNIESDEDSEDISAKEGQVLYKLHKYIERNKKIVKEKKAKALKETGKLACEACGFDFLAAYGEIGRDFIECHHTKPLAQTKEVRTTTLEDLALVCANCHRMLHRKIDVLTIGILKSLLI